MADDQIVGFFNDGELWLPFSSSPPPPTPQTHLIPFPKPRHTPLRLPDLRFQLFEPMVYKGSLSGTYYFSSRCNPATAGSIWTGQPALQSCRSPSPIQPPRKGWFLESRVVENRVVPIAGGNGARGYQGTGVYLPNYAATVEATATHSTSLRKCNNVRATKQVNNACLKRCSPAKAHALKEDDCDFELPPEIMALPQEWTY